jgi:hypothetical protein
MIFLRFNLPLWRPEGIFCVEPAGLMKHKAGDCHPAACSLHGECYSKNIWWECFLSYICDIK